MDSVVLSHLLAQAERQRLTLFIGPDLPQAVTGVPSAAELAAGMAKRFGLTGLDPSPALADVAQAAGRMRFRDVLQYLMDHLGGGQDPQPVDLLLARLPVERYVTTRLDDLLGRAFEKVGRSAQALVTDFDAGFVDRSKPMLLKLYGDLRQPTSLTVTQDQLFDLPRDKRGLLRLVEQIFSSDTVLFLGADLDSPDFLALWRGVLRDLGRLAPRAYAAPARPLSPQTKAVWADRNITVLDDAPLAVVQALAERLAPVGTTPPPPAIRPSQLAPRPSPPITTYRNFDLELSRAVDGHILARVLRSPEGEGESAVADFAEMPPPLDGTPTLRGVDEEMGRRLFPGGVAERWAASLATADRAATDQAKVGLRLRLFLADPSLAGVAWEAAKLGDSWPALSTVTPVVRYVSTGRRTDTLAAAHPLRMLALISDAVSLGLPALDTARERALLAEALAPLEAKGALKVEWRAGAITRRGVLDDLRRVQPHLLHFIGHGLYDEASGLGSLVLSGEGGDPALVTTEDLAILLDGTPVQFAFFNACRSGRAAGGVAQAVVRSSVAAAVGMQVDAPDQAAADFAGAVYRAIADGWPIDAAVAEGRKLLSTTLGVGSPWWALPALYSRLEDGRLFG